MTEEALTGIMIHILLSKAPSLLWVCLYLAKCRLWKVEKTVIREPELQDSDTAWGEEFPSSRRMWPQGAIFVALPHLGPLLVWLLAPHRMAGWCDSPRKLPWCPPHKVLLLVWTAIYSVMG
ncbi:translocator protein 2 [Rhinolophus sinicus]|uniref:translocator protein 2 n=1 Tax=Rhinolophus sinicus TaxID=89399 RepID=UPI003D7A789F